MDDGESVARAYVEKNVHTPADYLSCFFKMDSTVDAIAKRHKDRVKGLKLEMGNLRTRLSKAYMDAPERLRAEMEAGYLVMDGEYVLSVRRRVRQDKTRVCADAFAKVHLSEHAIARVLSSARKMCTTANQRGLKTSAKKWPLIKEAGDRCLDPGKYRTLQQSYKARYHILTAADVVAAAMQDAIKALVTVKHDVADVFLRKKNAKKPQHMPKGTEDMERYAMLKSEADRMSRAREAECAMPEQIKECVKPVVEKLVMKQPEKKITGMRTGAGKTVSFELVPVCGKPQANGAPAGVKCLVKASYAVMQKCVPAQNIFITGADVSNDGKWGEFAARVAELVMRGDFVSRVARYCASALEKSIKVETAETNPGEIITAYKVVCKKK